MLADPYVMTCGYTTLTANAADNATFAASERAADHSLYRFADAQNNDHQFKVGHSYGRTRNRFTARYDVAGIAATIADPSLFVQASQSCYVVFDCPGSGPLMSLNSATMIARKQCIGIGSLLVAVAADPLFLTRIVNGGET